MPLDMSPTTCPQEVVFRYRQRSFIKYKSSHRITIWLLQRGLHHSSDVSAWKPISQLPRQLPPFSSAFGVPPRVCRRLSPRPSTTLPAAKLNDYHGIPIQHTSYTPRFHHSSNVSAWKPIPAASAALAASSTRAAGPHAKTSASPFFCWCWYCCLWEGWWSWWWYCCCRLSGALVSLPKRWR